MTSRATKILARVWSSTEDFFILWWREATGPMRRRNGRLAPAAVGRRFLAWAPVIVLALVLGGALGFHFVTGWRARDLAVKAVAQAEAGEARFARLQMYSARNLRANDPAVKRAAAMVESRLGNPEAVRWWEEVPEDADLSGEEIEVRAEVMSRQGSEEQFAAAVSALDERGEAGRAAELRAMRSLRSGNFKAAIGLLRDVAADDHERRLRLLQLLVARYEPVLGKRPPASPNEIAAVEEMTSLVDQLADTPSGDMALGLGVDVSFLPAAKKAAWAELIWRKASPENPALLLAAAHLVRSGARSVDDLSAELGKIYETATIPQQVELAIWLNRHGRQKEALALVTAERAEQDAGAYQVRSEALMATGDWEGLRRLGETTASPAPQSLQLSVKALAAHRLGGDASAKAALSLALQAGIDHGGFTYALSAADRIGQKAMADQAILAACGDAETAASIFPLARLRFSRSGQFATLAAAYEAARLAAPDSVHVKDHSRRVNLLAGLLVPLEETASAQQGNPGDMAFAATHALNHLRKRQPQEALIVFNETTVFADRLLPGELAILAAAFHANGDSARARASLASLDPNLLTRAEKGLVAPLLQGSP